MTLSIAECLRKSEALIASDSARLDTELLLERAIKKNRSYFIAWPDKVLSVEQERHFLSLFERRLQGEPVAYILGKQGFWNLELEVNSSTLIPRPETELLVELALDKTGAEAHILDLGSGTGAIALALASELNDATVLGVDRVAGALELAEKNRVSNGIANVSFEKSVWFDNISKRFDIIVSNPPYIETGDAHLTRGDVRFEPKSALVSGQDGLDDIRIIVEDSKRYLFEGGWLLVEHGYNQGEAVRLLFAKAGFDCIETVKDLARNDRVTLGCLPD